MANLASESVTWGKRTTAYSTGRVRSHLSNLRHAKALRLFKNKRVLRMTVSEAASSLNVRTENGVSELEMGSGRVAKTINSFQ